MSLRIIFLISIFISSTTFAQNYGNADFYICGAVDLDLIIPQEKVKLDSVLELFHKRDLSNDTLGVFYLEQLIDGFETGNIEELYRYEYLKLASEKFANSSKSDIVNKRLCFAKGYAYASIGVLFWRRSNQDSALYYFQKAEPLLFKTDSISTQALVINASSTCYKNQGKLNEAVVMSIKALELVEISNDSSSMGSVYNNLGGLHQSLGNYDKALNYYYLAIECTNAIGFPEMGGIGLSNIAEMYFTDIKDTAEAERCALEAEKLINDEMSSRNMYLKKSAYSILAKIKLSKGDLTGARIYFDNTLELSELMRSSIDKARSYNGLASVNLAEGNIKEAKEQILSAIKISEENKLYQEALQANNLASQVFKSLGDYKSSLSYFEKASEIKEILNDQDQKKSILKQSYEYDFTKKVELDSVENSKVLAVAAANEKTAQVEADKSRFQSVIALAIAILVVMFLWIIFNRLRIIGKQKKKLDIAYDQLEETKKYELAASNLKAIKSQMNPHFIFNAVNSIQDLVLQKETIKSYDYLVLFSQMVRTILDFSEREFIPISEEIEFLNKYLGLEKLRFEEDFDFEIIADNCPKGMFIPSLIIQPFAENAIKHGLLHKKGAKKLTIRFDYGEKLVCFVQDNGIGEEESRAIQRNRSSKHKSFSTDAITQRLRLLHEQTNSEAYYVSSTIMKDTQVEGTLVEIVLPVKNI